MAISPIALSAYQAAMNQGQAIDGKVARSLTRSTGTAGPSQSFTQTLTDSLQQVNNLQENKDEMVRSFAAGETQNVHELMINLQKAGLAMQMTTAVRGKVLEAYRDLIKMQF